MLKDHFDVTIIGKLEKKVDRMMEQLQGKCPHAVSGQTYDSTDLHWWTSGFWPGMLWIMHEVTGKASYREAAWSWDEVLEQCFMEENTFHHDVGFQFLPTAVIKHRLTGDKDARRRGLFAANFLAGRFNLAGGYIRAWNDWGAQVNNSGWAIIDCSMNLSILFWAAEQMNDPRFTHIARAHADTVIRQFIRDDGSVNHIVCFDPRTGQFQEVRAGQGFAADSAWSRGAAWALYRMANTYRYTGETRYLEAAERVAGFFTSSLEEDCVPLWDLRVTPRAGEPRDTSAAAIAASGLLELAKLSDSDKSASYRESAEHIVSSLTDAYAEWEDESYEGILKAGTGHRPAGKAVDTSLIYGDYFYLEAIAKLSGWKGSVF